MDGHSYKCVSLHQSRPHTNASQCIRGPSTRGGHYVQLWWGGTMQRREISRSRTKAIPGNASFLGYLTPSRRGGMPGVRLTTLKSRVTCHFLLTPQKMCEKRSPGRPLRPRPSLSQHQPLITVIPSARCMSETAPILDTADLQAGWTMLFWPSHDRLRLP